MGRVDLSGLIAYSLGIRGYQNSEYTIEYEKAAQVFAEGTATGSVFCFGFKILLSREPSSEIFDRYALVPLCQVPPATI